MVKFLFLRPAPVLGPFPASPVTFATSVLFIEHLLCVSLSYKVLPTLTSSIFILVTTYDIFLCPSD